MADTELNAKTIALIDSLKTTTGEYGLANGGSEYRIITEIFLYKFFNDKFGYEAKNIDSPYKARLLKAPKWDAEYDTFSEDEVEDLFTYLPGNVPRLKHWLIFTMPAGAEISQLYLIPHLLKSQALTLKLSQLQHQEKQKFRFFLQLQQK